MRSLGVPLDQVKACATALATWLVQQGFCRESPADLLRDVLSCLDREKANSDIKARTVYSLLRWLLLEALPELDPSIQSPAEAVFALKRAKLARRVMDVTGKVEALREPVCDLAERRMTEAEPWSREVLEAYTEWADSAQRVLKAIEPFQPVPRTRQHWRLCLTSMAAGLHHMGFSDAEIGRLLPNSSEQGARQARYRDRVRQRKR